MPQKKLMIVPVSLQSENRELDLPKSPSILSNSICVIKTASAEISFFTGIDERIIQTVMRELKHL